MSLLSTVGRMALSTIFVSSGLNGLQNKGYVASVARDAGLPEPELLEQAHHVTNVVAGSTMALGIFPRLSAVALLANLVPATFLGHDPEGADDEMEAMNEQIHQFKNTSLAGALLMVIGSGGKDDDAADAIDEDDVLEVDDLDDDL